MPKYSLEEIGKFLQQVEQREQDADIEGISTSLSEEKAAVVRDCNEELAKERMCSPYPTGGSAASPAYHAAIG